MAKSAICDPMTRAVRCRAVQAFGEQLQGVLAGAEVVQVAGVNVGTGEVVSDGFEHQLVPLLDGRFGGLTPTDGGASENRNAQASETQQLDHEVVTLKRVARFQEVHEVHQDRNGALLQANGLHRSVRAQGLDDGAAVQLGTREHKAR
jgi:hypothetical protein